MAEAVENGKCGQLQAFYRRAKFERRAHQLAHQLFKGQGRTQPSANEPMTNMRNNPKR
jgi:hypothetical protein